jgi:glycine/D-amino acid oxidase-like deaminating enzyme
MRRNAGAAAVPAPVARIYENTPARALADAGRGLSLTTPYGGVRAGRVVLEQARSGRCCAGSRTSSSRCTTMPW